MKTIEQALAKVSEEYRQRVISGTVPLLNSIGEYMVAVQGKMLRPKLLLLSAATATGGQAPSHSAILLAVAVEMLHNASLLHDDVVDSSIMRREHPSINARWGDRAAILAGDYFLAQIMQIIDEVNNREAMHRMINTVADMTSAELLQLEKGAASISRDMYRRITCGKTARLMSTSCALGNAEYEQFGLHYGMAFQLRDDLNDGESTPYTATMLEEEVGLALRELDGKESNIYVQELRAMTNKLLH